MYIQLLLFGWRYVAVKLNVDRVTKFGKTIDLEMNVLQHMLANDSTAKDEFAVKCRLGRKCEIIALQKNQ